MAFEGVTGRVCRRWRITPDAINRGRCFDWAQLVNQQCPSAQIFYIRRLVPHAFVHFAGRWFDSQTPNGVSDWRRLPLFRGCGGLLKALEPTPWQPGDRFWRQR
ncbi:MULTISPECIES: hypothetical protein [Ferrimonas]|uniref:hypothetical protein n=1 Tax=Ferrimonas TaxID=44011 RepID=UPI000415A460|nr:MULTISPECIES: hypothetical protein [Ferrimonas]USD36208.1 hypothetical protein J8Z22_14335 [Ferrimonas sp. SCSIO 43195]